MYKCFGFILFERYEQPKQCRIIVWKMLMAEAGRSPAFGVLYAQLGI